jgi:cytochrome c553
MTGAVKRAYPRSRLALAILGCPPLHAADYLDLRTVAPIGGDASAAAAKANMCMACHGPGGNSLVPMFPRLAGQREDFLYWHLVEYKRGHVPASPMTQEVANLTDEDMRNLAAFFALQTPQAPRNAPVTVSDARGGEIYANGNPTQGIPPCQGCHGADPTGQADPRFRIFPVLRGQQADYVVAKLKEYRSGALADSSTNFIMQGVAGTLSTMHPSMQSRAGSRRCRRQIPSEMHPNELLFRLA